MDITPDSEILRLEKRQRGLQRVATAINDLTIYGIYPTNFPKLVTALEHSKDHVKAEITATKKRIIELGGQTVEEVFTDPLIQRGTTPAEQPTITYMTQDPELQNAIVDEYTKKGI
jgi:hypothetical protein